MQTAMRPDNRSPLAQLLRTHGLVPGNATSFKHPTHYPHAAPGTHSMLDDVLISRSLPPANKTSLHSLTCTALLAEGTARTMCL